MIKESLVPEASPQTHGKKQSQEGQLLGPLLCWAIVFADVGTSVYYVPGILYGSVGNLAGFFVFLTMSVFVLLTLKYAEITYRFPQGGGVVTVGAQAINHWFGALGGMFILVDYFLTAAISCLSGMLYLSVVFPAIGPFALEIAIGVLILLGILNWVGVSESAKVSLIGAIIAFVSDLAILYTVLTHISFSEFLSLFSHMFSNRSLTPISLLIGFAGSFLAFSGLESISQISPVMKLPRKKVSSIAMILVVVTIGFTSPLLTMFATLLLPQHILQNPVLSAQVISLLGGHWGNAALQIEIAISASALLVFASNTAIIGTYHVFLALSRMEFFPRFILRRNKLRNTPHFSILLAVAIPIVILVAVNGNINMLGELYAFGLLGAFTITCIGLDIVRHRERKAARAEQTPSRRGALDVWHTCKFYLGLLTTALVLLAWSTNLVAKPLATAFGGAVTLLGMGIAFFNHERQKQQGHMPVPVPHMEEHLPESILAVLTADEKANDAVMHSAIHNCQGDPVVFLYLAQAKNGQAPHLFEYHNPYHDDRHAKRAFGKAKHMAKKAKVARQFVYKQQEPGTLEQVWQVVHPREMIIATGHASQMEYIHPGDIRNEVTLHGPLTHLLTR